MKKKLKSAISLLLVLMLVFSLAACASDTGTSGATDGSSSEPAGGSSAETSSEGGDSSEPVELYVWEMTWGTAENMELATDNLVAAYEEAYPNVTVRMEIKNWDGYLETFSTAIASGTTPDVATAGGAQVGLYHSQGELLDLAPVMDAWEEEGNEILDDFVDGAADMFKFGDEYAAICFGIDAKMMLYRTDLLEEAGFEGVPSTFEEFRTALEMCKEAFPDKTPLCAPGNGTPATHNMCIFLGWGGSGYTDENMVPCMTSDKAQEVMTFISDLYKDGLIGEGDAAYLESDAQRVFAAGDAVFVLGQNTASFRDSEFFEEIAIMPALEGGWAVMCPNPIMAFSSSANNQVNPQVSYDYIKWYMENNKDFFIESGHSNFPTRSSFYEDPYWADEPIRQQCYDYIISVGHAEVYPVEEFYPAFLQVDGELILSTAFQQLIMGEDPMAVGEETNQKIQDAIDTYNG